MRPREPLRDYLSSDETVYDFFDVEVSLGAGHNELGSVVVTELGVLSVAVEEDSCRQPSEPSAAIEQGVIGHIVERRSAEQCSLAEVASRGVGDHNGD